MTVCSTVVNSPCSFGASLTTTWVVCSSTFGGSSAAGASSTFGASVTSAVTVVSWTVIVVGSALSWGASVTSAGASAGALGCSWTTSVLSVFAGSSMAGWLDSTTTVVVSSFFFSAGFFPAAGFLPEAGFLASFLPLSAVDGFFASLTGFLVSFDFEALSSFFFVCFLG